MFSSSGTDCHEDRVDIAKDLASLIIADKDPRTCRGWCGLCRAIHRLIWEMAPKYEIRKIRSIDCWSVPCSSQGWLRYEC